MLPENKVPNAENPPETPEILWSEQTDHPSVWCLTQGARSLYHPEWTAHSTVLQRWYHDRPPWKPCQYQQSNGPGQNMRLLAQHGSRHDQLHQAVSHMHQVQQSTSWDAETPRGPSQTLGKNRCWLLSRPFGKKHLIVADYFRKFLYMFPVASAHHFKTITHLRLFAAEGIPTVVMSDNGPPFNGQEFRQFAHDFDTPIMGDHPIPSRDSTWSSHSRSSSFKTIQKSQYTSDQAETHWTSRKTEGKLQQSPQSQRSTHSQSQGTSPVLSQQTRHRPH